MPDPSVSELIAEVVQLTRENRALRWLAEFDDDRNLAAILAHARDNDGLNDVLMFLHWALERELVVLPDGLLESGFERQLHSEWAVAF